MIPPHLKCEKSICYDFRNQVLAKEGIKVILGTPTPAPPVWMIELHPDILPVDL